MSQLLIKISFPFIFLTCNKIYPSQSDAASEVLMNFFNPSYFIITISLSL